MTMKLVQKHFLAGTREFEIIGDAIYARSKSLFREEKSTISLSAIDPEPVETGTEVQFYGRASNDLLLSLLIDKPNAEEFSTFVTALMQRVLQADRPFSDSDEDAHPAGLAANSFEEPPEFDEPDDLQEQPGFQPVNPGRVDEDITMLKTYLNEADIQSLLASLEALKAEPDNESAFQQVVDAYNKLGFNQGAVLTYAPYLKVLLSHTIWS